MWHLPLMQGLWEAHLTCDVTGVSQQPLVEIQAHRLPHRPVSPRGYRDAQWAETTAAYPWHLPAKVSFSDISMSYCENASPTWSVLL